MVRAPLCAALLLVAALARSDHARAEDESDAAKAERLFNEGLTDMRNGRYDTGCPALAESYRLDPLPGALFTLAECQARWGRITSAVTYYKDFLSLYEKMAPGERGRQRERAEVAEQQVEKLEPVLPKLTVKLAPGTPAGAKVTRNGKALDAADLGTATPVDPGAHRIGVTVPGKPDEEQTVVIARGEEREVVVGGPLEPGDDDDDDGDESSGPDPDAIRAGAITASAVGAAAGIVSVITGVVTLVHKNTIEENCNGLACNPDGKAAADDAAVTGTVSTVGLVVGAAGLAAAIVLWLLVPDEETPKRENGATIQLRAGASGLTLGF